MRDLYIKTGTCSDSVIVSNASKSTGARDFTVSTSSSSFKIFLLFFLHFNYIIQDQSTIVIMVKQETMSIGSYGLFTLAVCGTREGTGTETNSSYGLV